MSHLLSLLALSFLLAADPVGDTPWEEVLSAPQGEWPALRAGDGAGPEIRWRDDLRAALAEAREHDRPLFVTARCLPCKQCAGFDAEVLEGGPLLTPLLAHFVTVRLTDAAALDVDLLRPAGFQDPDLSWWGTFLSPEGRIYGVFGGRDHVSDATRISVPALANALERVLDHHYDPRRAAWNVDGPAPEPRERARTPRDLPGHDAWLERSPDAQRQACLHCHQIAEILRQPGLDDGTFVPQRDVYTWPLPENVGLELDRDHGLRVTRVSAGGAAAALGVEAGDVLLAAGPRRLFSQTDLRGVLHRHDAPEGARIPLRWRHGDELRSGTLELAPGWRRTNLEWRMSVSQGNIGAWPGFFPNRGPRGVLKDGGGLSISPFFGRGAKQSPAFRAGLRPNHVIVAVNGERPDLTGRGFLVWFRLRFRAGDEIALQVIDRGHEEEVRYVLE